MATTLSDLRSQLQTEVRDPNDKIWNTSSKDQYINAAYFQIQKDNNFEWRWNQASTTLSSPYTLPSDFVMMDLVTEDNNLLYLIDKIALRRSYKDITTTGNPIYYYYDGTTLGLYPVGTPDLVIDYKKKLTALSSDTDAIEFPDDFADAIVKYAKYLAWSSPRGNRDSANEALADYSQQLSLLMGSYGLNDMNNLTFGIQRTSQNQIYRDNAIT